MPTYRIITLGCKVNQYESLQVQQVLQKSGYTAAESGPADLTLINTCSVTSAAAAKSRYMVRRHARTGAKTIALGCWATASPEAARAAGAHTAVGHQQDVAEALAGLLGPQTPYTPLPPGRPGTTALPLLQERQPQTQRALLKVQDGCDAYCTYCIIPQLRPLLWSKPADEVIEEARALVAAGHHELVLTGVFLGAYAQETALHRRQTRSGGLAELVSRLCQEVPGLARIRLSSLEPADLTEDLARTLARHRQVMPHFHLPLQSGSDGVLRKMNRQYTRGQYLEMVHRLRQQFDRPALTTDIIVGFPTETDEDFAQTLEVVQQAGFLQVHAFPFSPRTGTAAARWKAIPQRVATERMEQLTRLANQTSLEYRRQFLGEIAEILVEHPSQDEARQSDGRLQHGRCQRYFAIHFESDRDRTGERLRVQIQRISPRRTMGLLLDGPDPA